MIFMVVFLSGLANGLGDAISASIDKTDAEYFIISTDAEKLISTSKIDKEMLELVASQTNDKVTSLNIKRSNVNTFDNEKKLDITYFSIDPISFLNPDITEGDKIANAKAENPVVLEIPLKSKI